METTTTPRNHVTSAIPELCRGGHTDSSRLGALMFHPRPTGLPVASPRFVPELSGTHKVVFRHVHNPFVYLLLGLDCIVRGFDKDHVLRVLEGVCFEAQSDSWGSDWGGVFSKPITENLRAMTKFQEATGALGAANMARLQGGGQGSLTSSSSSSSSSPHEVVFKDAMDVYVHREPVTAADTCLPLFPFDCPVAGLHATTIVACASHTSSETYPLLTECQLQVLEHMEFVPARALLIHPSVPFTSRPTVPAYAVTRLPFCHAIAKSEEAMSTTSTTTSCKYTYTETYAFDRTERFVTSWMSGMWAPEFEDHDLVEAVLEMHGGRIKLQGRVLGDTKVVSWSTITSTSQTADGDGGGDEFGQWFIDRVAVPRIDSVDEDVTILHMTWKSVPPPGFQAYVVAHYAVKTFSDGVVGLTQGPIMEP